MYCTARSTQACAQYGLRQTAESLRQRCVVTTIDPDTGDKNPDVFHRIRREFGGRLALNGWVIEPGTIHIGDDVRVVESSAVPDDLGGWCMQCMKQTLI